MKKAINRMNLSEREAKEFVHWIISQLDHDARTYEYWYGKFLDEIVYPLQNAGVGLRGNRHARRCFKGYNTSLKLCESLCIIRVECKAATDGLKRCIQCARFAVPAKKYCYYHVAVKSRNEKRIRRERVASGLCMGCGRDNDNKNVIAKAGRRAGKPLQLCTKCRDHIKNLQALKKSNGAYIHPDLMLSPR